MSFIRTLLRKISAIRDIGSVRFSRQTAIHEKLVRVTSPQSGARLPKRDWLIVKVPNRSNSISDRIVSFCLRFNSVQITMDTSPPEHVRGMKELDKSKFTKTIQVPSLVIPKKMVGKATSVLRQSLLKIPGIKCVVDLPEESHENKDFKKFLIDPSKHPDTDSFKDEVTNSLQELGVDFNTWTLVECQMRYENWTYDDILKAILPEDTDGVAGFSMIGHICHLNLRDEVKDYKKIIGDVLIDKVPAAKTVVNKLNIIDNTFRNFQMEVLAGSPDFVTTVKEDGFQYEMDFSKVYWNPRLGTEHRRIVSLLDRDDVVYDMFAGIGPFAVPAAKKKCQVFANDLNPESYKWLVHNVKLNKIKTDVNLSNLDGRQFVKDIVMPDLLKRFKEPDVYCDSKIHIVMNLPALAIEFLDVFKHLFTDTDPGTLEHFKAPIVHCYCFSKSADPVADVRNRVEEAMAATLPLEGTSVRLVRNVAPNKEMLCVTFPLLKNVLFKTPQPQECGDEPKAKKFKEDDERL